MFILVPKPLNREELEKVKKRFDWLLSFLIVRYRFVHQILGMTVKVPDLHCSTMGVRVLGGSKFQLSYNPHWLNKLLDEEAIYVLFHEVLHMVLHHCTTRSRDNKEVWNYAMDAAVNELIPENPGSCVRPKDKNGKPVGVHVDELIKEKRYKDIEHRQSAEWYYDYFMKRMTEEEKSGNSGGNKSNGNLDDHDGFKEDEIADEVIRAKVKEVDRNDLWGDVSQGLKETVLAAQTKRINWRNYIRSFFGNMAWKQREATRKRPNRRMGYIHPGSKKLHVDKYLVAVDTSGSIDSGLLAEFLSVINGMTDFLPIDLMQFDAEKTDGPRPFERRQVHYEFTGRGGTDFQPVMDTCKEQRYKGLVILTDGCAAKCTKPPCRVLWVLPKDCNPPVDWGTRIHMDRNN